MKATAVGPDKRWMAGWARLAVWGRGGDLEVDVGALCPICFRKMVLTASLVEAVSQQRLRSPYSDGVLLEVGWGRGL